MLMPHEATIIYTMRLMLQQVAELLKEKNGDPTPVDDIMVDELSGLTAVVGQSLGLNDADSVAYEEWVNQIL